MRPKIAHLLQKLAASPEDYIGGAVKLGEGESALRTVARGLPGLGTWHYMTGPHLERAKRLHVLRMKAVNEGWPAGEAFNLEREQSEHGRE